MTNTLANSKPKSNYKKGRNSHKKRKKNFRNTPNLANEQPKPILPFVIDRLSHEGRGVAMYGNGYSEPDGHETSKQGKRIFVNFALPNEVVTVQITNIRKKFEQGDCTEVIENPHPDRQQPLCLHYTECGGCSLQHLNADAQIVYKQATLAELISHQTHPIEDDKQRLTQSIRWLDPIIGDRTGYRSKARIGVRYIANSDTTIIGFRSRASNHLIDIDQCPILHPKFAEHFTALQSLLVSLEARKHISHLEVAVGEDLADKSLQDSEQSLAVIIRHIQPLLKADIAMLTEFFKQKNWQLYLQGNEKSIVRVDTRHNIHNTNSQTNTLGYLYYQLPKFDITMAFVATDFTQVNYSVNRKMVDLACQLLDLQTGETVLDLFCGLGNFSLPMAREIGGDDGTQGLLIGVEGSQAMQQRATNNATANQLNNTKFFSQDLTQPLSHSSWAKRTFDAILIDPPRSGAMEIVEQITRFDAKRIVYVSCNPATLARDAQILINNGYHLSDAGVMDMFCHTGHVESIAKFEKV